jgi:hypothetical protein
MPYTALLGRQLLRCACWLPHSCAAITAWCSLVQDRCIQDMPNTMDPAAEHAAASCALQVGKKNRSVGATLMNQDSSRSHSIFSITIETIDQGAQSVSAGMPPHERAATEAPHAGTKHCAGHSTACQDAGMAAGQHRA